MQQGRLKNSRYRILQKLFTLSAILIGFMIIVGIVSYINISYQRKTIDIIANDKFTNLIKLSSISRNILTMHNELARVVRWVTLGYMTGDEGKQAILRQSAIITEIETGDIKSLSNLPQNERELLSAQLREYDEWVDQIGEIIDKDNSLADLYLGSADEIIILLVNDLARLESQYNRETQQYFRGSTDRFTRAIVMFMVLFMLAVAVSITVAYFIGRSIVRPLTVLANKASAISTQRDLSQRIELQSSDEVGVLANAFNAMIESLKDFYDEMRENNTRLEQAHNELDDLNKNLELKVAKRTAEMSRTNEQLTREVAERAKAEIALRSAKQEAETASQAKSAFLASMSHELRTPLNGILGYAQIMQRDQSLNDTQQNGVRIIRESGEHLLSLINDILDLAKIEAGRLELAKTDFAIHPFLDNIVELFRMRAQEKGLGFHYQAAIELPQAVHGDERRLRQIFFNLLGNAVKFTNTGKITLEVGYDLTRLQVRILDQGCGIAEDQLEKIFMPFQQTGAKIHRAEGTGLGLAITKHMVEAMQGQLQVESKLGEGSCFAFELELPEAVDAVIELKTQNRKIIGYEGDERCILVVDDRPQNRAVLLDLLGPLGFRLEEAADGEEALVLTQKLHPQLILLDLIMPKMDGFEFARRMRRILKLQKTVIIAVSASVLEGQSQEAIEAGCDAFLSKPIQTDALFTEMAKQLGLQWRFDAQASGLVPGAQPELLVPQEIIAPQSEQIDVLYDLAVQGDIQGVTEYVQRLQDDPELQPFVQHIQILAGGFRERELVNFLESFAQDNTNELAKAQ